MKWAVILLAAILAGCASTRYADIYEGGFAPDFNIKGAKTIGFTPFYWTDSAKVHMVDQIEEGRFYELAKKEFEKRGFKVFYIHPEHLSQDSFGNVGVRGLDTFPDLTLTVSYTQSFAGMVNHPGESSAYFATGANGYYASSEGYQTLSYRLEISYALWRGKPDYREMVWRGTNLKGSGTPDLDAQSSDMTAWIFYKKFDSN